MSRKKPNLGKVSPKEFEKLIADELASLKRRIARIEEAKRGNVTVERVWRKGHPVPAHRVRGHYMLVTRKKENV